MRDLKADLEICNKATPGPWKTGRHRFGTEMSPRNGAPLYATNIIIGPFTCNSIVETDLSQKYEKDAVNDNAEFVVQAREGWPHAIDRAIKAEAEVERLQTENALLHKVAEAASEFVGCPCEDDGTAECAECTACNYRQALAELDEESE